VDVVARAGGFVWCNARLLERALFAYIFVGGPAECVRRIVGAYQNPDGGFGHALEPDIRGPTSQPLHVEQALRALQAADIRDSDLAAGACDFLASVAADEGQVPIALPTMLDYPRAAHWAELDPPDDSPNPTAALVGLLLRQGAEHPWLERATAWCWRRLEAPITEAHAIRAALTFLQYAPERERAERLAVHIARQAIDARYFLAEPDAPGYGLTPLHLVPSPDAVGRAAFSDSLIAAHLDRLLTSQQEDGGWPITWTPPSPAAEMEWRGIWTVEALTMLRSYGVDLRRG
jgi:hypothetical protein